MESPDHGWYILSNLFKYHAACYMVHSSIEAARKLQEQFGVTPDRVERIQVQLEESCDRICNIPAPRTGLEAKFSLRLATAMGFAGIDTGRLSTYSESVARDPDLVRLRDKVDLDFRHGIPNTFAAVEVLLTDGRRFRGQPRLQVWRPRTPRIKGGDWRKSSLVLSNRSSDLHVLRRSSPGSMVLKRWRT